MDRNNNTQPSDSDSANSDVEEVLPDVASGSADNVTQAQVSNSEVDSRT